MDISDEDIKKYMEMGSNEEEIMALLKKANRAENRIDSTRGHSATIDAGAYVIPNYMDAISGMFERGKAKKDIAASEGAIPNLRAARDQAKASWLKGLFNDSNDATPQITPAMGPGGDIRELGIPHAQQVSSGLANMQGPPQPPQAPPPAPAPVAPPAPPPAPKPPVASELPANQTGYPMGAGPGNALRQMLAKLMGIGGM